MAAILKSILDWLRSLFFKEEMELTLVGLQNSGKTTLVNVIAVKSLAHRPGAMSNLVFPRYASHSCLLACNSLGSSARI